jgi:peptide/nickel transport system substrate-binding protein
LYDLTDLRTTILMIPICDLRNRLPGLDVAGANELHLEQADTAGLQGPNGSDLKENAMLRRSLLVSILAFWTLLPAGPTSAQSDKTLRVVMHSDLKILDPIWTTAYIVRNHGYLIYDTLFALDDKLEPKPQMVESWTVSDDQLTWTFKLRDGLKWHDGQPVTTADVLPSIKRFTDKDALGGLLGKSTKEMTAVDGRTFRIVLSEPFAMMLKALAKSASVPLFIMPKRVAETPVSQQISDTTGSGPYVF